MAWMGWSCRDIGNLVGLHEQPLIKIRAGNQKRIHVRTAAKIELVYNLYCMRRMSGKYAEGVRALAIGKGWVSPLAWENIYTDESPKALLPSNF